MKKLLSLIMLILLTGTAAAQTANWLIPNAGITKDMRSETSNRWEMGFNGGVNLFFGISERLSLGGRVQMHYMDIDGEGWRQDHFTGAGYTGLNSASGSQTLIEIIPSLRYMFTDSGSDIGVSVQAGAGLVLAFISEVKVKCNVNLPGLIGWEEKVFNSTSLTGFSFQLGVPISIGKLFEVLPIYTLYNASGDFYHHISFNAAVKIEL